MSDSPNSSADPTPVSAPQDWFYGVDWRPMSRLAEGAKDGTWLILSDKDGVGSALASALPGSIVVERASQSGPKGANGYSVDASDATAMGQMLAHFKSQLANCRGVVYLWGLDQTPVLAGDQSAVNAGAEGVSGALELTKSVLDAQVYGRDDFRLYLVTRNSQDQGNTSVDATQAPLWGLGRCIGLEHPELRMCCVDLDGSGELGALLALLQSTTVEDQICLRGNTGYSSRLTCRSHAPATLSVEADATYLVTGGLGALGLMFAQRLAERGAKHLVLLGRSAPKPEAEAVLSELRGNSCTVEVAAVDVTDASQLTQLVDGIAKSGHPLKGVIHAAGILDDGVLVRQTPARFESVLAPKVQGTVNLYNACLSQPLDFMVFCSSVASMFGAPGQSNYAAANAFMDSFAAQIRALGVPAVSVNWGPWAEAGMAQAHLKRIAARGLPPLDSPTALNAFEQVATGSESQVGIAHLDMVRLSALGPRFRNRPLTLDLFAAGDSSEAETQTILEQLKQSPEAQRAKVLETWFAAQVALLLGLDLSTFDVNKPLTWLGLDSLMAVDLKKAFDDHLGTDVPHALIQSGPSVAELSLKVVAMVDVNAILDGATASESGSEGGTFGALTALRAGDTASPVDLAESAMGSSRVASEPGPTTAEDDESVPPAVVAALVGVLGLLTVGGLWYLFG